MRLKIEGLYRLNQLKQSGCEIAYDRNHVEFSAKHDVRPPMEVDLIKIPDDWDGDQAGWAPEGYKALGLSALIAIGMEFPRLQKTLTITATGAIHVFPGNFVTYPYLGVDENGNRVMGISGGLFTAFPLREKIDLWGIFSKV